ncbi:hypothetical protein V6N13_132813 [Hibiscus sabdariffa]|uniref:Auxin-responsive protein n=1 Tax=Hibiscus sabdariffa TaxID=183260 RepID=A0ABR2PWF3_9ROSI
MSTPLERSSGKISSSSSSSVESVEEKTRKTIYNTSLNLKETELRLGLPGSQSPDRKVCLFGKDLESNDNSNGFAVSPFKNLVFGAKRSFSDAIDEPNEKWVFSVNGKSDVELPKGGAAIEEVTGVPPANDHASAPAAKAQAVGWPPVRSFRKNTMASNSAKNSNEAAGGGCLYVKVSMDGAPYLRNVDLKTCKNYMELSSALEKMFSCFTKSSYVATYEDKEGDWMLVGDVPWQMFSDSCRRIRIMKSSSSKGHGGMQEQELMHNNNLQSPQII